MSNSIVVFLSNNLAKNKAFYLEYQPQVNKKEKVVGVEALLRCNHPGLGNIPPDDYFKYIKSKSII
ncbi:EAL domain-containing protein [Romboutsia sp.]|uniref:EAL domain-containing protein n=1 Tax=Romboutsia sp. TaxID=1965302 RepID=UPI003F343648